MTYHHRRRRRPIPTVARLNYDGGVLINARLREQAARFACLVTAKAAARRFHVSDTSILRWARALGLKPRRTGALSKSDLDQILAVEGGEVLQYFNT